MVNFYFLSPRDLTTILNRPLDLLIGSLSLEHTTLIKTVEICWLYACCHNNHVPGTNIERFTDQAI